MRSIVLFVEDACHRIFIETLVRRIAVLESMKIRLVERSVTGGFGRVTSELKQFLNDLGNDKSDCPDLIVVATDSNCKGVSERRKSILKECENYSGKIIHAIPDPHIERWLLQDSGAFKKVFGKGCEAPDQKCEKDRYKKILAQAVRAAAGISAPLGGIEYADEIAENIDLEGIKDQQLRLFIQNLRNYMRSRY